MFTRRPMIVFIIALLMILPIACTKEPTAPRQGDATSTSFVDYQEIAYQVAAAAGWPIDADGEKSLLSLPAVPNHVPSEPPFVEREVLTDRIAHYKFQVRTGPGPYDVIGIHRVVKEQRPHHPIRTGNNIFLLHGDWKNFEGCFVPGLHSPVIPIDFGFAVYLAQNGIDVWGIDQAWALVPENVTDFSFMSDWGMDRHVEWANTGVDVARAIRLLTGSGYQKMILAGYSGGAPIGFTFLNNEAGRPDRLRKARGFIPLEWGVLTDDPAWEQAMCDFSATYQSMIDSGHPEDVIILRLFGIPARDDPNGPSQLIEGLTNLQAALALGSTPLLPGFPCHFFAGTFDEQGVPTGFRYTDPDYWVDFMVTAPYYEAAAYERDEYIWTCSSAGDVPWDDHFADVQVPILYVEAGGGFGPYGARTLDQLGSSDKTVLHITLDPGNPGLDFGHLDLFLSDPTPSLAWQPMLDWIRNHSRP